MPSHSKYLILALDHRSSLRRLINSQSPELVSTGILIRFKEIALKALLPQVNYVLIDPDYGLPALRSVSSHQAKIIMSIEKSGYVEKDGERLNELLYTVEALKKMGAAIVKLLIYFNRQAKSAPQQKELVNQVALECEQHNLKFLLEPIPYALKGQTGFDPEQAVLETAGEINLLNCPIGIYKTDFPGGKKCQKLTKILRGTPWVLLSGGDDFDEYKRQLKSAITGGASGFAAGRALWKDFVNYEEKDWESFFRNTVVERLREISAI